MTAKLAMGAVVSAAMLGVGAGIAQADPHPPAWGVWWNGGFVQL
ncbi:hypothetical protein ORI20_18735 [Mycobacterium sp. CVI_P3]|uniref:Uncharacterized protein n=1 Tax=Mycobacterium pinniadriaticum TaxID=2994102 RepID=A0ABT3SH60_9MYCO|nr:hypothetical protein [Mycobacterium pinniadriaticum]MCX2932312.1 hypothetical protein [Mycobacterium pinniadriaticum]MCX2938831.1 hypothetical protein [Mycobacterium pinniadriaticum]